MQRNVVEQLLQNTYNHSHFMTSDFANNVSQARDLLAAAARVVIICHRNPDGDAIGSLLGLCLLIEKQFPGKQVALHCKDGVPETFNYLPSIARTDPHDPTMQEGDVLVFLDSAEPKLTEMHESSPELFGDTYPSICIDHHPTNSRYALVNIVEPEASSTCEIIVNIADHIGWEITSDAGTALLTGVYTDTGGLLHSNTSAAVYRTVARLLRSGARRQQIVQEVFRTSKLSTLKLWGRVLEKISLNDAGGAISAVTEGDFRATGADYSELTGAIDYVNTIPGMRFSLILSQRNGTVKGSLRTLRDDIDVSKMAGQFSGGGHRKAAGFSLPGKLESEVRWRVTQE